MVNDAVHTPVGEKVPVPPAIPITRYSPGANTKPEATPAEVEVDVTTIVALAFAATDAAPRNDVVAVGPAPFANVTIDAVVELTVRVSVDLSSVDDADVGA